MRNGSLPHRASFLTRALNLIGTPFLWGGKTHQGIDSVGVVTLALWECGGPDWRVTRNCDALWRELDPVGDPLPGDLAFYGGRDEHDVNHVMVTLSLGMVFGACGGDETTLTHVEAMRIGARVRAREKVLYRPSFRGFRTLAPYFA